MRTVQTHHFMYRLQRWSTPWVNSGTDVMFIAYLRRYTKVVHCTIDPWKNVDTGKHFASCMSLVILGFIARKLHTKAVSPQASCLLYKNTILHHPAQYKHYVVQCYRHTTCTRARTKLLEEHTNGPEISNWAYSTLDHLSHTTVNHYVVL